MKEIIRRGRKFKGQNPTERESIRFSGEDMGRDIIKHFQGRDRPPPGSGLDAIATTCWRVLASAELPSGPGQILVEGPVKSARKLEWRYSTESDRASPEALSGWHWTSPEYLTSEVGPELIPFASLEGYACRILALISDARRLKEAGEPDRLVDQVLAIGALCSELEFAEWYRYSQKRKPNAVLKKACETEAAQLWSENPILLMGEVAELVRDRILGAKHFENRTIRRWIRPVAPDSAGRRGRPPSPPRK